MRGAQLSAMSEQQFVHPAIHGEQLGAVHTSVSQHSTEAYTVSTVFVCVLIVTVNASVLLVVVMVCVFVCVCVFQCGV